MDVVKEFVTGMFSVLKVTSSPVLYRYHYRNSADGLRKDWVNIASDIESVIGKLEENGRNRRDR